MKMKILFLKMSPFTVLAMLVTSVTMQAARTVKTKPVPKKAAGIKPSKPATKPVLQPLPPAIPAGQPYFQPSNRISGIGLDRQNSGDLVLRARTKNVSEAQTFSILRDPRAVSQAEACNQPKLQELFAKASQEYEFPKGPLEAIAMVESGCDPNAISPSGAKGIMQVVKGTAKLMGLQMRYENVTTLVAQTKLIKKAKPGQPAVYKNLPIKKVKQRVLVEDERLTPEKAIPAAAKYLAGMARRYGGVDFAVWAYHSGEGRVSDVKKLAKKYGIKDETVPLVFFGNTPGWRKDLYELIEKDMAKDFGPTYYFCVKRAEELLALQRKSPNDFKALAARYKNNVKPDERAPHRLWVWYSPKDMYRDNSALENARGNQLFPAPQWPEYFSYSLRTFGAEAIGEKDPGHRELFLQDPPEVVGALEYIAFETRRLWEDKHPRSEKFIPLEITGLVRNLAYQQLLKDNPNSRTAFPTHTVGAVDISYLRLPKWEAKCLKFVIWDMGLDEFLGYFLESKARQTIHVGTSPSHKDFFVKIYQEAQTAYTKK